ncbi:hypothetical protein FB451DRAFT_1102646 [Mycena latifolia]|nr:hypothetical protein FB451DRAFT_1102646 [Mycena latifolia]
MFDDDTRWSGAPSSSPPSSPTAYNDSSPASSPGAVSFPEDDDFGGAPTRASPPVHPFAASAKGSWIPPDYEKGGKKNRRMSPSSPTRSRVKKPRLVSPDRSLETLFTPSPRPSISLTETQKEKAVWDIAVGAVIDHGNGAINLENRNLSTIPAESIADLHKFFVPEEKAERSNARVIAPLGPPPPPLPREFARSSTAPAILGSGLTFPRVGVARQEIQLFLAGNRISRLPLQLLCLDRLTVLSLRNNQLKTLPPEVRHLKNLKTLNVSGNQLHYLPAELLDMSLTTLNVHPNPFKEPEEQSAKRQFLRAKSVQGRVAISPTSRILTCVPPLVELAFRSMFAAEPGRPATADHSERRLAQFYELPLYKDDELGLGSSKKDVLPPHLRRVLDAIHPGSVCKDETLKPEDNQPSLGLCPSPRHGDRTSIFVTPAEERFTWEPVVAGVSVGGNVPLKWRGCLWGCLDFLSVGMETENPDVVVADMEVDDENGAVTQVDFASGGLDFEDGE